MHKSKGITVGCEDEGERESNEELWRGKGKKSLLYLTESSFPTVGIVCFLIRVIVGQSDPIW